MEKWKVLCSMEPASSHSGDLPCCIFRSKKMEPASPPFFLVAYSNLKHACLFFSTGWLKQLSLLSQRSVSI
jgi:hypothetical protein